MGAVSVHANENLVPGSPYDSARANALGGASLPLADDGPSALYDNPAGFGKIKASHADFDETIYLNQSSLVNGGTNIYQITSLPTYATTLQSTPNSFQGFGGQIVPSYSTRGFGIGLLINDEMGASADASGNIHYRSLYQLIPAVGGAIRMADGLVRLGCSLQWVNQASGVVDTTSSAAILGYNQKLQKGSGIDSTVGVAFTLPYQYLPSFNLVGRNLFTTYGGNALLIPAPVNNPIGPLLGSPPSFDTSFSIQPKIASGVVANLIAEYRDMTNRSGVPFIGRLALGAEIAVRDSFFLRLGFGTGYPSAGVGVKTKRGEISFTWYSAEIGTTYLDVRDIRYAFQYQLRVF